ncbi:serine hydrolase-domain-containing protein [Durotheca rogersii]|uniref:serine hydrolase-domain-containing protein n=1 Tax=Durotheca rogersii TaxID=419775 RepID=UPI00221EC65F|nr:serine hydrolase-domain-containing protein [Durotheca rogersii]KAI5867506.1 serine hydrolase-domain-containing protein [Durotheca rogersii]
MSAQLFDRGPKWIRAILNLEVRMAESARGAPVARLAKQSVPVPSDDESSAVPKKITTHFDIPRLLTNTQFSCPFYFTQQPPNTPPKMSWLGIPPFKKFHTPIFRPLWPFFAAGLIVLYGVNSAQTALMNSDEWKDDPRHPNARARAQHYPQQYRRPLPSRPTAEDQIPHAMPDTLPTSGAAARPSPAPAARDARAKPHGVAQGKTELRILMLHGFTQSGPLFSSKTKGLAKVLNKVLGAAPVSRQPTLLFPTGPCRLRPSDIPGYVPSANASDDDDEIDSWCWFRNSEVTGTYRGLDVGMNAIAAAIRDADGPVDGVIGFSQGGAVAALVAAVLEHPHREVPAAAAAGDGGDWSWVSALRAANRGLPLRFCVVYSGFYAPPPSLRWLYDPPIVTPTLHFLGGLDTVVDEARSRALVACCRRPVVLVHPGGHYVPVARDWAVALAGWLRQRYDGTADAEDEEDSQDTD